MYVSNMIVVWAILAGVLIAVEAITAALTTIWFAIGALAALVGAVFGAPVWLQIVLFLIVSVLMLALTRPIAMRYVGEKTVKTNADSLVGQEAVVTEKIDNLQSTGAVQIRGQIWTARSVNPEHTIEVGEIVMVRSISGVKLMVGKRLDDSANAV